MKTDYFLLMEAIFSILLNFQLKKSALFSHCLLVTNTSSFLLDDVSAKMTKLRENFGGLHFFNPVPAMKLVEVIRAPDTSDSAYNRLMEFCERIGKTPVKCEVS